MFSLALFLASPVRGLSRIWEANLARPADLLFTGAGQGQDPAAGTFGLPYPTGDWYAAYTASAEWNGWLRKDGAVTGEIASGGATQALWIRPEPLFSLALTWSQALERNRYTEPGKLDATLGESRAGVGLAAFYRLLPGGESDGGESGAGGSEAGNLFFDLGFALPDLERQGFAWTLSLGRGGIWRAGYGMDRGDVDEPFAVENLDSAGGGEKVEGAYRTRSISHRISGAFPLVDGSVSLGLAYSEAVPYRPEREFWFGDSSRRVDGSLRYVRRFEGAAGGEWSALAVYRETQSISLGRRIPPGSEGLKRFHYAHNHGRGFEAGVERNPLPAAGKPVLAVRDAASASGDAVPTARDAVPAARDAEARGLSLGAGFRDYAWKSTPSRDALDLRSETLSYNRLGLSFIANLYGGLFKESEIVSGSFHASAWEVHGGWHCGIPVFTGSDNRSGPLSAVAGLSLYRTDFRLRWEGRSLSQRLFTVDTSAAYGDGQVGYLIGATPRLGAAWSQDRFRVSLSASQVIPLKVERDGREGGSGNENGSGGGSRETTYPLFRNGFTAGMSLEAFY